MVEFRIYLSDDDTERLFILKNKANKQDWTGNDFAKEILIDYLHSLYPHSIKYDDQGNVLIY